jgi:hypothetical protein
MWSAAMKRDKISEFFAKVKAKMTHVSHKTSHVAHRSEHVIHLGYFGAMVFHMDYKLMAMGCLIAGILALLPSEGGE